MKNNQQQIQKISDHLFRREAGKMVTLLTKIFGIENLQLSEDVVQDTFVTAIQIWSLKGLPDNPSAWFFRTAKNKAIDVIRRNKFSTQIDFNDPERSLLKSEYTLAAVMDKLWKEDEIQDDLLRMMFACCHPEISEENQITLILKTLCGFSTAEIAKAFLTSEDTISKRLYRTKNFFRDKKIKPAFPPTEELLSRTEVVLKATYLIFNEGYHSTQASDIIRKDLLQQAMYLCGLLCTNPQTQLPEVFAAMALMYFHSARTQSRVTNNGEIVLLDQQDRSLWDIEMIASGNEFMDKAASGERISTYHIEAAIAYEHCVSPTFEETNWQNILRYYDMLASINPSSVVLLNRLTVYYKIHGAQKALEEIERSDLKELWQKNYLYHCLLGDILAISNFEAAKESYLTAISMTSSEAEKALLQKKINSVQ